MDGSAWKQLNSPTHVNITSVSSALVPSEVHSLAYACMAAPKQKLNLIKPTDLTASLQVNREEEYINWYHKDTISQIQNVRNFMKNDPRSSTNKWHEKDEGIIRETERNLKDINQM